MLRGIMNKRETDRRGGSVKAEEKAGDMLVCRMLCKKDLYYCIIFSTVVVVVFSLSATTGEI